MVNIAEARVEILASGATNQHDGDKCRRALHFELLDFGAERKVTWEMFKLFIRTAMTIKFCEMHRYCCQAQGSHWAVIR